MFPILRNFNHNNFFRKQFLYVGLNNCRVKHFSSKNDRNFKARSTLYYIGALGVFAVGMSYAAVPLYRIFCQVIFLFYFHAIKVPEL